jgi:NAD(P)-dependent dehydrogenase (short-subunit alcohol dehydrogenase family)
VVLAHYAKDVVAAEHLAAELGDRVHLIQTDLMLPNAGRMLWNEAVCAAGPIDVLVNNAGAYIASPIDEQVSWESGWLANFTLNVMAPADLCRSAILHFQKMGGGTIVNVTSRSAHRGDGPEHLAYGAAKGALQSLTKGIARGFARERILAYAVAPGWVATEMTPADQMESLAASLPLAEVTPPEDVAEVIAFLASGRAPHATGTTVDITGADYVR